jgi:hypothetical protein
MWHRNKIQGYQRQGGECAFSEDSGLEALGGGYSRRWYKPLWRTGSIYAGGPRRVPSTPSDSPGGGWREAPPCDPVYFGELLNKHTQAVRWILCSTF